jgi:hypothetical protein
MAILWQLVERGWPTDAEGGDPSHRHQKAGGRIRAGNLVRQT